MLLQLLPSPSDVGLRMFTLLFAGAKSGSKFLLETTSLYRNTVSHKYNLCINLTYLYAPASIMLVTINEVTLQRARLVLGWVTVCRQVKPSQCVTSQLSLTM